MLIFSPYTISCKLILLIRLFFIIQPAGEILTGSSLFTGFFDLYSVSHILSIRGRGLQIQILSDASSRLYLTKIKIFHLIDDNTHIWVIQQTSCPVYDIYERLLIGSTVSHLHRVPDRRDTMSYFPQLAPPYLTAYQAMRCHCPGDIDSRGVILLVRSHFPAFSHKVVCVIFCINPKKCNNILLRCHINTRSLLQYLIQSYRIHCRSTCCFYSSLPACFMIWLTYVLSPASRIPWVMAVNIAIKISCPDWHVLVAST